MISEATTPENPWDAAKPGDIIDGGAGEKFEIVQKRMRIKREAQELAQQVGGEVFQDGATHWAVVKRIKAPAATEQPAVVPKETKIAKWVNVDYDIKDTDGINYWTYDEVLEEREKAIKVSGLTPVYAPEYPEEKRHGKLQKPTWIPRKGMQPVTEADKARHYKAKRPIPDSYPDLDAQQPVVHADSRHITANHSPARHIDDGTGHPICGMGAGKGTAASQSVSFTASIDVPTCQKCRNTRHKEIVKLRQSRPPKAGLQAKHEGFDWGTFVVNVEQDEDGVYHIENAPYTIKIGDTTYNVNRQYVKHWRSGGSMGRSDSHATSDWGYDYFPGNPMRYFPYAQAQKNAKPGEIIVKDAKYDVYRIYRPEAPAQSAPETPEKEIDLTGEADRKGVTPSDVDQEQLAKGVKVESEHTTDPEVAEKIATDHLAEIPDYYDRLEKMETEAKQGVGTTVNVPFKVVPKSNEEMGEYIALHGQLPSNELPERMRGKIPEDEIWIRQDVYDDPKRRDEVLNHEQTELKGMTQKGQTYKEAHAEAEKAAQEIKNGDIISSNDNLIQGKVIGVGTIRMGKKQLPGYKVMVTTGKRQGKIDFIPQFDSKKIADGEPLPEPPKPKNYGQLANEYWASLNPEQRLEYMKRVPKPKAKSITQDISQKWGDRIMHEIIEQEIKPGKPGEMLKKPVPGTDVGTTAPKDTYPGIKPDSDGIFHIENAPESIVIGGEEYTSNSNYDRWPQLKQAQKHAEYSSGGAEMYKRRIIVRSPKKGSRGSYVIYTRDISPEKEITIGGEKYELKTWGMGKVHGFERKEDAAMAMVNLVTQFQGEYTFALHEKKGYWHIYAKDEPLKDEYEDVKVGAEIETKTSHDTFTGRPFTGKGKITEISREGHQVRINYKGDGEQGYAYLDDIATVNGKPIKKKEVAPNQVGTTGKEVHTEGETVAISESNISKTGETEAETIIDAKIVKVYHNHRSTGKDFIEIEKPDGTRAIIPAGRIVPQKEAQRKRTNRTKETVEFKGGELALPEKAKPYTRGMPKEQTPMDYELMYPDFVEKQRDMLIRRYQENMPYHEKELERLSGQQRMKKAAQMDYWKQTLDQLPNLTHQELGRRFKDCSKETYVAHVKDALRKQRAVPVEVLNQYPELKVARTNHEAYLKGKHTSFANVSVAVDYTPREKRGYKAKRQDGKTITEAQLEQIESGMNDVETATGSLKTALSKSDLTVSHTSGKYPFLTSGASGLYHPGDRSISTGMAIMGQPIPSLGHEVGHWMDYEAGRLAGDDVNLRKSNGHTASYSIIVAESRRGDGKLIDRARRTMSDEREAQRLIDAKIDDKTTKEYEFKVKEAKFKLGHYYQREDEIWARLFEQYVAYKNQGKRTWAVNPIDWYYNQPAYWTKGKFEPLIPEIEEKINQMKTIIEVSEE